MTTVEQRGRQSGGPSLDPGRSPVPVRRRSKSPNPLYREEYAVTHQCSFDFKHPICEGYLHKEGHHLHVFNKRYFVLYPDKLLYYKSESDFQHDKQKCHLSKGVVEMHTDGLYLTKPAKKPKGGKFSWVLHLPNQFNHRNDILLVAHCKEERHMWMTHLQAINPNLHPHHPHHPHHLHHSDQPSPDHSPPPPGRNETSTSFDTDVLCVADHSDEDDSSCSSRHPPAAPPREPSPDQDPPISFTVTVEGPPCADHTPSDTDHTPSDQDHTPSS